MSTVQCVTLAFEATQNNTVQYFGSNTVLITAGGANAVVANSSSLVTNNNVGIGNSTPATKFQIDGNYGIKSTSLGTGNNFNINCASGNYFIVTCNSSSQNVYFTNAPSGTAYGMIIKFANGSGGNTLSFANTPKWPSATAPTSSTNTDIWVFLTDDAGATWRGNQIMKDSR